MGLRPKVLQKHAAWPEQEDLRLEAQYQIHGNHWSKMDMPNRAPVELKNRWNSAQRVSSSDECKRKRDEREQEDERIRKLVHPFVNALPKAKPIPWKQIVEEHFPDRKIRDISNRWHLHLKPTEDSATVSSVTVSSMSVSFAIEESATVASVDMPSATMPSVDLPRPQMIAFMTPGVDGAINDITLLGGTVIVFRGDLGEIDPSPTLAFSKLKAACESFGGKAMRNFSFNTSKLSLLILCMSLFYSSYIRWFISAHLLLGKGVDKSSRKSIRDALKQAQINRSVVIEIPTLQSILRGEQPLPKQQLPQPTALVPAIPSLAIQALSPAIQALSPAMSALLPAMPALSPAMSALPSAMSALSPAMSAQPPVDGLDGWCISSTMSNFPINNYDENDIIVEIVAEENEMDVEVVVPVPV
jgi:hypothetical protein